MINIVMSVKKSGKFYRAVGEIHGVKVGGFGATHFKAIQNALGDVCTFCDGTGIVEVGEFDNHYQARCLCQIE